MTVLIIIVSAIASIIGLVLLIALFVKKEYALQRHITINQPVSTVFDYIKYLKNQDKYSKWVMTDPGMKKEFKGIDGTAGFMYKWDSDNKQAGAGEQEIISVVPNKKIDIEVRFERPFKSIAYTPLSTDAISASETRVTWGMHGKSKYPMNIMTAMMRKVLEKDLDTSLKMLKYNLEKS